MTSFPTIGLFGSNYLSSALQNQISFNTPVNAVAPNPPLVHQQSLSAPFLQHPGQRLLEQGSKKLSQNLTLGKTVEQTIKPRTQPGRSLSLDLSQIVKPESFEQPNQKTTFLGKVRPEKRLNQRRCNSLSIQPPIRSTGQSSHSVLPPIEIGQKGAGLGGQQQQQQQQQQQRGFQNPFIKQSPMLLKSQFSPPLLQKNVQQCQPQQNQPLQRAHQQHCSTVVQNILSKQKQQILVQKKLQSYNQQSFPGPDGISQLQTHNLTGQSLVGDGMQQQSDSKTYSKTNMAKGQIGMATSQSPTPNLNCFTQQYNSSLSAKALDMSTTSSLGSLGSADSHQGLRSFSTSDTQLLTAQVVGGGGVHLSPQNVQPTNTPNNNKEYEQKQLQQQFQMKKQQKDIQSQQYQSLLLQPYQQQQLQLKMLQAQTKTLCSTPYEKAVLQRLLQQQQRPQLITRGTQLIPRDGGSTGNRKDLPQQSHNVSSSGAQMPPPLNSSKLKSSDGIVNGAGLPTNTVDAMHLGNRMLQPQNFQRPRSGSSPTVHLDHKLLSTNIKPESADHDTQARATSVHSSPRTCTSTPVLSTPTYSSMRREEGISAGTKYPLGSNIDNTANLDSLLSHKQANMQSLDDLLQSLEQQQQQQLLESLIQQSQKCKAQKCKAQKAQKPSQQQPTHDAFSSLSHNDINRLTGANMGFTNNATNNTMPQRTQLSQPVSKNQLQNHNYDIQNKASSPQNTMGMSLSKPVLTNTSMNRGTGPGADISAVPNKSSLVNHNHPPSRSSMAPGNNYNLYGMQPPRRASDVRNSSNNSSSTTSNQYKRASNQEISYTNTFTSSHNNNNSNININLGKINNNVNNSKNDNKNNTDEKQSPCISVDDVNGHTMNLLEHQKEASKTSCSSEACQQLQKQLTLGILIECNGVVAVLTLVGTELNILCECPCNTNYQPGPWQRHCKDTSGNTALDAFQVIIAAQSLRNYLRIPQDFTGGVKNGLLMAVRGEGNQHRSDSVDHSLSQNASNSLDKLNLSQPELESLLHSSFSEEMRSLLTSPMAPMASPSSANNSDLMSDFLNMFCNNTPANLTKVNQTISPLANEDITN
eukprot:Ihof_evm3s402 gene=Ihof_evmTU3s402